MKRLWQIIQVIILAGLAIGLIFYFEDDIRSAVRQANRLVSPCGQPVSYTLGEFDRRFILSQEDFLQAISLAAKTWEEAAGKKLFIFRDDQESLKINLIYDWRQQAADKLKQLGLSIKDDQGNYEVLKNKYNDLDEKYNQQKIELDNSIAYYKERSGDYQAEVKAANQRGGVDKDEYDILEQERAELDSLAARIKKQQTEINETIGNLNALAAVINKLIKGLNLNVGAYNSIGEQTAGEFQAGRFVSDAGQTSIDIYQFDDFDALVRVLTHELGHALGLEHLDSPQSVMYYLSESGNDQLTSEDIAALKKDCRLE